MSKNLDEREEDTNRNEVKKVFTVYLDMKICTVVLLPRL